MEIIIITGGVAFVCFILTTILAFLKYKNTKELTNVWLVMGITLFFFSIYVLSDIFYSLEIYAEVIENIRNLAFVIGSVFLFSGVVFIERKK